MLDKNTDYLVYGVKGDAKTEEVLSLAKDKGFKMKFIDLRASPHALADWTSRGFSRFPTVVREGKPNFTFVGHHTEVVDHLNSLDDGELSKAKQRKLDKQQEELTVNNPQDAYNHYEEKNPSVPIEPNTPTEPNVEDQRIQAENNQNNAQNNREELPTTTQTPSTSASS